jgi:GxxExxY protein
MEVTGSHTGVTWLAFGSRMLAPLGPINDLTSRIIKAAIEVHRNVGPGLLEAVYFACLVYELRRDSLSVECEQRLPVVYKGMTLDCHYRIDLVVQAHVVVELKAVDKVLPVHLAQLLTQLRLAHKPVGLLLNFNVPVMKEGISRLLNKDALPVA